MFGISYTVSGVSSIETRHSFPIAGWQSVNYDLKLGMIYRMVIRGLQEEVNEVAVQYIGVVLDL